MLATQTLLADEAALAATPLRGRARARREREGHGARRDRRLGVDGGVGHVIEYAGPAIESLSMEGRLTICNMSIEAGARAGMIAPDETTFAYLEGRPGVPSGAAWERTLDRWRALPTDAGATFDREVVIDVSTLRSQVTWGTNPGMVVPIDGVGARSRRRSPTPTSAPPPSARSSTWARAGDADPGDRGRPRLHRLLHELEDRGPARRSRGRAGKSRASLRARDGRPRLRSREGTGRGRRARPGLRGGRIRMAARRLLDVPRHEPRRARARRAVRVDVEPELRGPSGRRRPHASRQSPAVAAATALAGHFARSRANEGVPFRHVARGGARPARRRHRPDHPEAVPEADRAHRLRRVPLLRLAQGSRVRAEPAGGAGGADPAGRPQLRLRLVARARAVGARGLRLRGDRSRRRTATSSGRTR